MFGAIGVYIQEYRAHGRVGDTGIPVRYYKMKSPVQIILCGNIIDIGRGTHISICPKGIVTQRDMTLNVVKVSLIAYLAKRAVASQVCFQLSFKSRIRPI